jgi:hypothetical protein
MTPTFPRPSGQDGVFSTVSDTNLDVVPQESVVDFPSEYQAPEAEAEAGEPAETPAQDAGDDEEPVSLDGPQDEAEEADADGDTEPEEDGEEADEVVVFDFGGNKLEVKKGEIPPEVAEKVDQFSKDIWADYTKKSQINADTAKAIKAREESLAKVESLGGEALDAFTQGKHLRTEIEQLSAVNMQALWQSNPDKARQLTDLKAAKQAELQSIIQYVDQYERQLDHARQEDLARRSEDGRTKLDRKFKGFSTDIAPKLEKYVQETYGMSADEASQWAISPDVTEMAYKAMLYDQMRAANKPKATPRPASPVRSMPNKGGAKGATNPNEMGFGELAKVLGIQ